ncbi:MAG: hypothetical protein Q9213_004958 [Squamulea squamosa]
MPRSLFFTASGFGRPLSVWLPGYLEPATLPIALSTSRSGQTKPLQAQVPPVTDLFPALSPDQSTLVLRGNEEEASSVLLKGTLVLCLAEPLKVQNVRLRLTGERRVLCGGQKKDERFLRRNWDFVVPHRRGETLAVDNYEWPFDHILPGNTPESVEGLLDCWIIYRMKATIERGILAQDIIVRKHIRLVRTLDTAALALSHEMRVDSTWLEKVNYTISAGTKGVIFGTAVEVNFRIASLLKGLKVGKVITSLVETQDIWIDPRYPVRKKGTVTRLVAEDTFEFPQDQETELVDGQDSWVFSRRLTLPKSLRECLQTVDTLGFRIRHHMVVASLPLHIYISPTLLVDDDHNILNDELHGVDPSAFAVGAPPQYGEHRSDTLYSDLDPAGYVTPAGVMSGFSTPFNSQSRRGSADSLAGLTTTIMTPIALQSRLAILGNTATGSREDLGATQGQQGFIHANSQQDPVGSSSRQTSQHFEHSPEEMSKVPSYTTALRSQPRTPLNEVPPTYQSANR